MRTSFEGPSNFKNNLYRATANVSVAATLGTTAVLGLAPANAEPVYSAPGTGRGHTGPEVTAMAEPAGSHHVEVDSPGLTPVLDSRFSQSVDITKDNYANAVLEQGDGSGVAFSASTIALRELMAERPDVAFKIDQVTYIGDPCKAGTGVLVVSVEARTLSGQACPGPSLNPGAQEVQIFDREDPIANFHFPISLIDAANMLAAYELRHPYTDSPDSHTVTEYDENGVHMIRLDHRNSALRDWLAIRGLHIDDNGELMIQGGLHPDSKSPAPPIHGAGLVHDVSMEAAPPLDPVAQFAQNLQEEWRVRAEQPFQEFVASVTQPAAAPAPVYESFTPPPADTYVPPATTVEVWQQEVSKYVPPEAVAPVQQAIAVVAPVINALPPAPVLPPLPALPPLPQFAPPQFG